MSVGFQDSKERSEAPETGQRAHLGLNEAMRGSFGIWNRKCSQAMMDSVRSRLADGRELEAVSFPQACTIIDTPFGQPCQ